METYSSHWLTVSVIKIDKCWSWPRIHKLEWTQTWLVGQPGCWEKLLILRRNWTHNDPFWKQVHWPLCYPNSLNENYLMCWWLVKFIWCVYIKYIIHLTWLTDKLYLKNQELITVHKHILCRRLCHFLLQHKWNSLHRVWSVVQDVFSLTGCHSFHKSVCQHLPVSVYFGSCLLVQTCSYPNQTPNIWKKWCNWQCRYKYINLYI